MKRLMLTGFALVSLVVGPAKAADLKPAPAPVYTKAPVMAPVFSWTGFYIGLNGGYSWGRTSSDFRITDTIAGVTGVTAGSASRNINGWLGGGQIGYNWQTGTWVLGIETDIQGTGQKGTVSFATPTICPVGVFIAPVPCSTGSGSVEQKLPWFGTLRGRVGFTPAATWLLYATGGLAYGEIDTNATFTSASAVPGGPVTLTSTSASSNTTRVGWTAGAGVEWAFYGPWSAKLEYLFMDLGKVNTSFAGPGPFTLMTTSSRITDNIVRAGINYRFGGSSAVGY